MSPVTITTKAGSGNRGGPFQVGSNLYVILLDESFAFPFGLRTYKSGDSGATWALVGSAPGPFASVDPFAAVLVGTTIWIVTQRGTTSYRVIAFDTTADSFGTFFENGVASANGNAFFVCYDSVTSKLIAQFNSGTNVQYFTFDTIGLGFSAVIDCGPAPAGTMIWAPAGSLNRGTGLTLFVFVSLSTDTTELPSLVIQPYNPSTDSLGSLTTLEIGIVDGEGESLPNTCFSDGVNMAIGWRPDLTADVWHVWKGDAASLAFTGPQVINGLGGAVKSIGFSMAIVGNTLVAFFSQTDFAAINTLDYYLDTGSGFGPPVNAVTVPNDFVNVWPISGGVGIEYDDNEFGSTSSFYLFLPLSGVSPALIGPTQPFQYASIILPSTVRKCEPTKRQKCDDDFGKNFVVGKGPVYAN